MGFFDSFKNRKTKSADSDKQIVFSKYQEKCDFTVKQQLRWLKTLSVTIPTIMIAPSPNLSNPLTHDYYLHPRNIEEAGSMLNAVGRVAKSVSDTLSITNLERALQTQSMDNVYKSYCILDEYSKILASPYNEGLLKAKNYILNIIDTRK